ncbi:MAG: 50S ribosomal protein L4 [Desulfobacteraceae bacterium]|nr:50S ribosomal protein L4 [Desulfobacteraceae bacterium]
MAVVDVLSTTGKKVSQVELSDEIYAVEPKKSVLHEVVTAQLAARRAGTASVKRRADVTGSTRKLYRQKGTGRARKGSAKSPVLRGGGVTFGPEPRSYAQKVPKKVRRLALKMALSSKLKENELVVLDKINVDRIKTKDFTGIIEKLNTKNALFVVAEKDTNLELSSRNVVGVKVLRTEGLNVYDILKYEKLVLIESSIKGIEGRLLS